MTQRATRISFRLIGSFVFTAYKTVSILFPRRLLAVFTVSGAASLLAIAGMVSEVDQSVTNTLKTVGNVPSGKLSIGNYGTRIWIINSNSFELNGVFEDLNCPKGFEQTEIYPGHTQCIKIYYLNDPI